MRKGQLEMIGLMIIVIIIVIAALFYVRFALVQKEEKQDITLPTQAFNLMNAVLNVDICEGMTFRSAVVSCGIGGSVCGEECDFAGDSSVFSDRIDSIVRDVTYLEYSFYVSKGEIDVFKIEGCKFGIDSSSYPISERDQYYTARFKLCKN